MVLADVPRSRKMTSCSEMTHNFFRFTFLSKSASANHLESHSCKNKGLKVPCFHTLTKNIGGRGSPGVSLSDFLLPTSYLRFSLTPLDSALTSKRVSKSFTSNTYERHTQGEGCLLAFELQPPITSQQSQPNTTHQLTVSCRICFPVR